MASRNYDNNFFEISAFAALKSCKFDQFYTWEVMIEDKTFVEFLQNLENTMKEFSEVISTFNQWKVVPFLKKHSWALENCFKNRWS